MLARLAARWATPLFTMSETTSYNAIAENLSVVRARINAAAQRAGRNPGEITLVAVSKTKPIEAIQAAYAAGQRDFGENRVEELWPKVHQAEALGLAEIRWHLIGTIQSRKSEQAVGPFTLIHSLDRLKLADRLSRDAQAAGCVLSVLLEVNVSGEGSKHGFTPDEVRQLAGRLGALPGIRIHGLMTMAPLTAPGEAAQPFFRALRQLRDELVNLYPLIDWQQLSMGMTGDFEAAVAEGATLVRIGSAIFGERG
jgi:pyridoxal phosphate enzyme (YggS family)